MRVYSANTKSYTVSWELKIENLITQNKDLKKQNSESVTRKPKLKKEEWSATFLFFSLSSFQV